MADQTLGRWSCPTCQCLHIGTSTTPAKPWCEGIIFRHERVYWHGGTEPAPTVPESSTRETPRVHDETVIRVNGEVCTDCADHLSLCCSHVLPAPSTGSVTTGTPGMARYHCERCPWYGMASSLSDAQQSHWGANVACTKAEPRYSSVVLSPDAPSEDAPDLDALRVDTLTRYRVCRGDRRGMTEAVAGEWLAWSEVADRVAALLTRLRESEAEVVRLREEVRVAGEQEKRLAEERDNWKRIAEAAIERADDTEKQANEKLAALRAEVEIDNNLLAERDATIALIPGCPAHGAGCQPHARAWIEESKRLALRAEVERGAQDRERLERADAVFRHFATVPCLRELLGEDSDGCGCMGCEARAYFAAARAPEGT